jgi:Transposase DDE domain
MSLAVTSPRIPTLEDRLPLLPPRVEDRRHLRKTQCGAARALRICLGRNPQPSAGIADSQSAKTTGVGGEQRGYDGGKKIRGRKRHLLVDTEGLILKAKVHSAKTSPSRMA